MQQNVNCLLRLSDAEASTSVVATDADGSTSVVATDADGSSHVVATDADGSTSVVATDADGSSHVVATDADGSTSVVATDADGSSHVVATDADGSTSVVDTDADGSSHVVSTEATGNTTAVTTRRINPPRNKRKCFSSSWLSHPTTKIHCICRQPYSALIRPAMIQCDCCLVWYHCVCIGVSEKLFAKKYKSCDIVYFCGFGNCNNKISKLVIEGIPVKLPAADAVQRNTDVVTFSAPVQTNTDSVTFSAHPLQNSAVVGDSKRNAYIVVYERVRHVDDVCKMACQFLTASEGMQFYHIENHCSMTLHQSRAKDVVACIVNGDVSNPLLSFLYLSTVADAQITKKVAEAVRNILSTCIVEPWWKGSH